MISAIERMRLYCRVILQTVIRYIQYLSVVQVDNEVEAFVIWYERP